MTAIGKYTNTRGLNLNLFQTNGSVHSLNTSELRLNPHYIGWYRNLTKFTLTIFVPFILMTYWNVGTAIRDPFQITFCFMFLCAKTLIG